MFYMTNDCPIIDYPEEERVFFFFFFFFESSYNNEQPIFHYSF